MKCWIFHYSIGLHNHDLPIGVYAADVESYHKFAALLDKILEDYHGFKPTAKQPAVDFGEEKIREFPSLDLSGKYVKSVRQVFYFMIFVHAAENFVWGMILNWTRFMTLTAYPVFPSPLWFFVVENSVTPVVSIECVVFLKQGKFFQNSMCSFHCWLPV